MSTPLVSHDDIRRAAQRLRSGLVVAFPTETVYGLGADALNPEAVARVFALKGRPANNPLIVHVSGPDMAQRVARLWPDAAQRLARHFWPGPLTLVLPRADCVPPAVAAGGSTVALRAPDHPTASALLFEFAGPLVGPSANLSGRVSPTCAQHVRDAFPADQVSVLDGGDCGTGIESTVLDLTSPTPRILRPGVIGAHAIARVLGVTVDSPSATPSLLAPAPCAPAATGSAPPPAPPPAAPLVPQPTPLPTPLPAPGMLASHYAPRARAILLDSWELIAELAEDGEPIVALAHSLSADDSACPLIRMPPPTDPRAYAARLYAALRRADDLAQARGAVIAIERPPLAGIDDESTAIWQAVADRLARATRA